MVLVCLSLEVIRFHNLVPPLGLIISPEEILRLRQRKNIFCVIHFMWLPIQQYIHIMYKCLEFLLLRVYFSHLSLGIY